MKIQNINGLDKGITLMQGLENHVEAADKSLVFKKTLSGLNHDKYSDKISSLVSQIDEQGERLGKKADLSEYEKYRKLIKEFMNEVVSNGYSFEKENSFMGRGRHRFFATVKVVDEKLDALAKDVLSDNAESIDVIHQIDDIRGLLLDMML